MPFSIDDGRRPRPRSLRTLFVPQEAETVKRAARYSRISFPARKMANCTHTGYVNVSMIMQGLKIFYIIISLRVFVSMHLAMAPATRIL